MRHVIIYSWEEVKKVLENELEDDKYRVQVKPCLLKKGYGVVEIEEMDIMEGMKCYTNVVTVVANKI